MHMLTSLNNLPHNIETLLITKFPLGLEVVIKRAALAILGDDHKLFGFAVLAGDKLQEEGVGKLAEDVGLVFDEVLAEIMFHEILVDEFDADGLFIFAGGFVHLSGAALAYFGLDVVGLAVVR